MSKGSINRGTTSGGSDSSKLYKALQIAVIVLMVLGLVAMLVGLPILFSTYIPHGFSFDNTESIVAEDIPKVTSSLIDSSAITKMDGDDT